MEPTGKAEYVARMADGKEIRIYPDKFHHRAYTAPGMQIGEPFLKLSDLLASLGAKLATAEGQGAPSEWPEPAGGADINTDGDLGGAVPVGGAELHNDAGGRDKSVNDKESWPTSLCGHFKEEICGMDKVACDGHCGEHANRAVAAEEPPADAADVAAEETPTASVPSEQ